MLKQDEIKNISKKQGANPELAPYFFEISMKNKVLKEKHVDL